MPGTTRLYENGVVQRILNVVTGPVTLGTTLSVADNTTPQITEGNAVTGLTTVITPKYSTSKIKVYINVSVGSSSAGAPVTILALFKNGAANAVASTASYEDSSFTARILVFEYEETPGSTATITYSVRIGCTTAGTVWLNDYNGVSSLGNTVQSRIIVEEII